jgi:Ca2+-transporting ATPase
MPQTMPTDMFSGLSETEAQARLAAEGYNELPRSGQRTPLRIALEVIREPMLALLLGGGLVYLLLGSLEEALILLAFATMSIGITIVQETRTEHVLEALRDLTSPRALVIRDGQRKRIAGREVVRGDIVVLGEGDRVPADGTLLQSQDLQSDESLLTGESVPVRKVAAASGSPPAESRPGGEDLPLIFSGSLIVRGSGIGHVLATGPRSEIGKIGHSLNALETEPPRLQLQMRRVVRTFALVGAAVSVLAVLLYGMLRGAWLDAVLAGIALGMSMLPEEFPVVLTIFMAMGAWRISQARVLTRRSAAIETLGSATILCTDKTGTLTENRMTIAELRTADGQSLRVTDKPAADLPPSFADLAETGALASARIPFDPMEIAFHTLGRERLAGRKIFGNPDWDLVHAYPLRPGLLAMSNVWRPASAGGQPLVAAKGAPEAVAQLCRLDEKAVNAMRGTVEAMAGEGLRVLGVARAVHSGIALPEAQSDFSFVFLGLVGLTDPLRASVPEAVSDCRSAGIRVMMITGDYPATAKVIARQAGLDAENVVTGSEMQAER